MIDKKVVVVATGGTIAMKYDPEKDGLVPACTGEDLAAAVPELANVAPLEFIQFSNIASPAMTPQNMWDLHIKLEEVLARDDVAGAIVTHGTDTLEETSYFLDLLHNGPKPIVTTAAMRGAGDTKYTAMVTFITVLLVRPIIAIYTIKVLEWGLIGAWIAMVADQLLRTTLIFLRYNSGKWRNAYQHKS